METLKIQQNNPREIKFKITLNVSRDSSLYFTSSHTHTLSLSLKFSKIQTQDTPPGPLYLFTNTTSSTCFPTLFLLLPPF